MFLQAGHPFRMFRKDFLGMEFYLIFFTIKGKDNSKCYFDDLGEKYDA